MAVSFLAEKFGLKSPGLENQANPPFKVSDFPEAPRKYPLLYCVVYCGELTTPNVKSLAQQLYQDTLEGSVRSLRATLTAAGLKPAKGWNNSFIVRSDTYLDRVALSFSREEMEREEATLKPLASNEPPHSPVDTQAGSGLARPLLKRLYSLEGNRLVFVKEKEGEDTFIPGHHATALVDAMESIYSRRNWPQGLLMVFGPSGQQLRASTTSPN